MWYSGRAMAFEVSPNIVTLGYLTAVLALQGRCEDSGKEDYKASATWWYLERKVGFISTVYARVRIRGRNDTNWTVCFYFYPSNGH